MNIDLRQSLQVLLEFADTVGIDLVELQRRETVEKLRYTSNSLTAAGSRKLKKEKLLELQTTFGSSLVATWKIGDLPMIHLDGTSADLDLQPLLDATDDKTSVEFSIAIDKDRLLKAWAVPNDDRHKTSLFFFSKSLEQVLEAGLIDPKFLEQTLWRDCAVQAIVLVADRSLMVSGTFVVILGHSELAVLDSLPRITPADVEAESAVHNSCRDAVRWESVWTSFLTPNYFGFRADSDSREDRISQIFLANGVNVALLFSADRVRNSNDGFVASFAAGNSQCEVKSLSASLLGSAFDEKRAEAARKLAAWAYDERWRTDRLRLLQVSLTRVLSRTERPYACEHFLAVVERLEEEVRWHWKTFIADAVESYVKEETELENEIAETVDGYEAQVSSMIASLSGTVLAAIGVLIGSFIAAAFTTKFNRTIFQYGIGAYMAYLFLFPGLYNMLHHDIRFRSTNEIFDKRKQRFVRLLGEEATKSIIGNHVTRAKRRFRTWFWFTIAALGAVFIFAAIIRVQVPAAVPVQQDASTNSNQPGR